MFYQSFILVLIGFVTKTTSIGINTTTTTCPKYVFEPQPTYASGACIHPSSRTSVFVAPPVGCVSKHVSIALPVCNKQRLLLSNNVLDVQIFDLKSPHGHSLIDNLYSEGFIPIHQVPRKTLRDQGLFDANIINENTDIILNINTPDLNATYGWSGLPGQELTVVDNISSIQFGCNGYGPYEVYIVSCPGDADLLWCLIGLAERGGQRRNLLRSVVDYVTSPTSLLGVATSVVLEGARHLLRENSAFTKTTY
jgi:hypothetical protein